MTEINLLYQIDGARKAQGTAVITDVFRAGSVVATLLDKKVDHIVPCSALEESYALKKEGYILIGERNGLPPEGFDYGNSPSKLLDQDLAGKYIALNTSAGTQGIVSAAGADEILVGSFLNASAIEQHIRKRNPNLVSLVAMGYVDSVKAERAIEDDEFISYLSDRLSDKKPDFKAVYRRVRAHPSVNRFFEKENPTFPTDDFFVCMDLDRYRCVPKVFKENGRLVIRNIGRDQA